MLPGATGVKNRLYRAVRFMPQTRSTTGSPLRLAYCEQAMAGGLCAGRQRRRR